MVGLEGLEPSTCRLWVGALNVRYC